MLFCYFLWFLPLFCPYTIMTSKKRPNFTNILPLIIIVLIHLQILLLLQKKIPLYNTIYPVLQLTYLSSMILHICNKKTYVSLNPFASKYPLLFDPSESFCVLSASFTCYISAVLQLL